MAENKDKTGFEGLGRTESTRFDASSVFTKEKFQDVVDQVRDDFGKVSQRIVSGQDHARWQELSRKIGKKAGLTKEEWNEYNYLLITMRGY